MNILLFNKHYKLVNYQTGYAFLSMFILQRMIVSIRFKKANWSVSNRLFILSIDYEILLLVTFSQHTSFYLIWICGQQVFISLRFSLESTYQTLLNLPDAYLQNPYFVTIIPAFSFTNTLLKHYPCEGFKECVLRAIPLLPETKKDLAHCVKRNKCSIFRPLSRTHVGFPRFCHIQNYISSDWYSLNKESQVRYLKCFKHPFMEPYVMVRRTKELPLLEEVFINYGFNKVQWVENLRYLG